MTRTLGGKDGLPDEWDKIAEMLKKTAETVLGVTFGKRNGDRKTWWWNEEVQDSIKEKKEAKKAWNKIIDENTKKINKDKNSGNLYKVATYVRLVQDMYEGRETVVRCAVGSTESFKVKVGLHQGSTLSSFLFAVIMDRLTDEVRKEPPWMMLFADDIVICEETREEVERRLECWRYALEKRGMKVNR